MTILLSHSVVIPSYGSQCQVYTMMRCIQWCIHQRWDDSTDRVAIDSCPIISNQLALVSLEDASEWPSRNEILALLAFDSISSAANCIFTRFLYVAGTGFPFFFFVEIMFPIGRHHRSGMTDNNYPWLKSSPVFRVNTITAIWKDWFDGLDFAIRKETRTKRFLQLDVLAKHLWVNDILSGLVSHQPWNGTVPR